MAVLAFASAKGAPGVTTTVLALAFAWHRPALVVEADMAGSSSVLAGFLRGGTDHSHGLVGLAIAARQHGFTDRGLWEQCLRLGEERYLLPGIADPGQAAGLTTAWGPLAGVLADLEAAGVDVLVDAGRLGTAYAPLPLLRAADTVVLVTGTRLPDVYALSRRTPSLRNDLAASHDTESLCAVTVGEGRPYTNREIETSLGLRVAGSLAWDPVNAEVYSVGAPPGRRFETSHLVRTASSVASTLSGLVRDRRARLAPAPARAAGDREERHV
ncbi:MAG TPA: hypothetical protein VE781_01575 [Kineosporiaceae bacterium]|jgi:hypothetical protein|nr:hypothetical protein [Kineosporiaceae bacterium]